MFSYPTPPNRSQGSRKPNKGLIVTGAGAFAFWVTPQLYLICIDSILQYTTEYYASGFDGPVKFLTFCASGFASFAVGAFAIDNLLRLGVAKFMQVIFPNRHS